MINLKSTFWLLIILLYTTTTFAQDDKPYVEPKGLNNWFIELGGASMFYSLNYEKILYRGERISVAGRVGIGYNPFDYTFLNKVYLDRNTTMAPFTASFLYGRGKEKIEIGAGFTLLAKNITDREIVPTAILGFKVIETNKVYFKISYTPFIRDQKYTDWFGVSFGRNFSLK